MNFQNQINVLTVFFDWQSNFRLMDTSLSTNQIRFSFFSDSSRILSSLVLTKRIAAPGNEIPVTYFGITQDKSKINVIFLLLNI